MKISSILIPKYVAYPTTFIKLVLSKHMIDDILFSFKQSNYDGWKEYKSVPINDGKNKKQSVLDEVKSSDKCFRINYNDDNLYIMKNEIVLSSGKMMYILYCPPMISIPENVTDIWVKKIIPFCYNLEFTPPEVVNEYNFIEDIYSYNLLTSVIGKDRNLILKAIKRNGVFLWDLIKLQKNEEI